MLFALVFVDCLFRTPQVLHATARQQSLTRRWFELQDTLEALSLAGVMKSNSPARVYAAAISGKRRELKLRVRRLHKQCSISGDV